jgi:hypothetical protein
MRCLLKVTIPVETGNEAARNGTLPRTIEMIVSEMKPESCYFLEDRGERTGFVVFDMQDTSQIPSIAEPWFLAFNARVEFHPAMNLEDLKKSEAGIERAANKYKSLKKAA